MRLANRNCMYENKILEKTGKINGIKEPLISKDSLLLPDINKTCHFCSKRVHSL